MIINTILFFVKPETKFGLSIVILFVMAVAYLSNRMTRGLTIDYLNYEMRVGFKSTLVLIHIFGPLILALALPNNYLSETDFFKELYNENELWIAGSVLVLLLSLIILFGVTFTALSRLTGLQKIHKQARNGQ